MIGQTINQNGTESGTGTQTQSMGLGSILGGIAGAGLSGWASGGFKLSDRRAKTDIRRIGTLNNGLNLYQFKYRGGDEDQLGVMADEVARIMPEALGPVVGGYQTVNYGPAWTGEREAA
jgi:hypothetical protein